MDRHVARLINREMPSWMCPHSELGDPNLQTSPDLEKIRLNSHDRRLLHVAFSASARAPFNLCDDKLL